MYFSKMYPKNVWVDFVVGPEWPLVQVPLVLIEIVKDALESLIRDLNARPIPI